jgi:hypothetical protein
LDNPDRVAKLLGLIGNAEATGFPPDLVEEARKRLAVEFGVEADGSASGLQGWLYEALLGAAKDPEGQVPEWLKSFTPLGIEHPILPSGIFPEIEPRGVGPALEKLMAMYANKVGGSETNYSSYEESRVDADAQIDAERQKGYLEWAQSREALEATFGPLILSRMGAILSMKDGRKKLRLIHDLKRSLVNAKVTICERLVLPRLADLIKDILDLLDHLTPGDGVELFGGDFRDAFKQMKASPDESRYLAGAALGGYFVYLTCLFGVGSGPLVWGRIAAATMRLSQAMVGASEARLQCFVDDPVAVIRGPPAHRQRVMCLLLLLWETLGLKFAYDKATRGQSITWIGAKVSIEVALRRCTASLPQKKIDDLATICSAMISGKGMLMQAL